MTKTSFNVVNDKVGGGHSNAFVRMLFWLFAAYALGLCVVQAEFDIVFEDVDCPTFNEEYIKVCEFELNYDSTYGSSVDTYIEIVKEFPDDVKVLADVYTVRMGEYSVNVGIHLDAGFCEVATSANSIGVPILRAVNMDTRPCPPTPGIYQREGYVVDNMDGLPKSFPAGHYLLNMTFLSKDTALAHFDVYLRVY